MSSHPIFYEKIILHPQKDICLGTHGTRSNNALATLWWAAFRGRRSTMGCNSIRKYTTFGRMEWNWRRISDSMVHDFNGVASALVCGERRNQSMLIRCCIKFIVTNQTRFFDFFELPYAKVISASSLC